MIVPTNCLEVVIGKRRLLIVRDGESVLCRVENLQYLRGQGIGGLRSLLDNNLSQETNHNFNFKCLRNGGIRKTRRIIFYSNGST